MLLLLLSCSRHQKMHRPQPYKFQLMQQRQQQQQLLQHSRQDVLWFLQGLSKVCPL
jgi:hypothetical protein